MVHVTLKYHENTFITQISRNS